MTTSTEQAKLTREGDYLVLSGLAVTPGLAGSLGAKKSLTNEYRLPPLASTVYSVKRLFPDAELSFATELLITGYGFPLTDISEWALLRHRSWNDLYPFQQLAARYLVSNPHRGAILGLSPGLGKTVTAIVSAEAWDANPILVIAPKHLLRTWTRELEKWGQSPYEISYGKPPSKHLPVWTITNYDTVVRRPLEYGDVVWSLIIFDESILVKTRTTKRFKTLEKVSRRADHVWCLSGSPISRYADDLWTQFHLLEPSVFRSYWRFTSKYCIVTPSIWSGYEVSGTNPGINFQDEFRDLLFVKNQKDVLPDLPEYIYEHVDLDLNVAQKKVYDKILKSFVLELQSGKRLPIASKMAQLTRLLQAVSNPYAFGGIDSSSKHDAIVEMLESGAYKTPMLIWGHWVEGLKLLYQKLDQRGYKVGLATGETEDVDYVLEQYRSGQIDILLFGLTVGKFGHTLTNTHTVVSMDRTFDMDAHFQSLHRVIRIGLDHRPVLVVLRCPDTADMLVEENLALKSLSISKMTDMELRDLLISLRNED